MEKENCSGGRTYFLGSKNRRFFLHAPVSLHLASFGYPLGLIIQKAVKSGVVKYGLLRETGVPQLGFMKFTLSYDYYTATSRTGCVDSFNENDNENEINWPSVTKTKKYCEYKNLERQLKPNQNNAAIIINNKNTSVRLCRSLTYMAVFNARSVL